MNNANNSAQLEREVETQRHRVESTIDAIKERLSPGQLLDEVLNYTKDGGKEFASNLGSTVSANPMPTALLGVSLAWLIFGGRQNGAASAVHSGVRKASYGRTSSNGLQRISHMQDDLGDWYAEFIDEGGRKYRARSNALGKRAGHFIDDTGRNVQGFLDDAGQRVDAFRDEAGNMLDESLGWAAETWDGMAEGVRHATENAAHMAGDMQQQAQRLADQAIHALERQPLVAGALAFAAGAAIGAALPSTRQEDELVGGYSDEVKHEGARIAGDLYDRGKAEAAHLYEEASEKTAEVYSDAKAAIAGDGGNGSVRRPH